MMRRDAWREYSRGSLWLMPVVAVVLSIGLGAALSQIDVGPDSPLAFQHLVPPLRAARSALKIWGRSPADAVAL